MVAKKISGLVTLKKSRKILDQVYKTYRKKASHLDGDAKQRLQTYMASLRTAILQKEPENAARITNELEALSRKFLQKTTWDKARDFVLAIGSALFIALVI